MDFRVTAVTNHLISGLIFSHPPNSEWVFTRVYEPLNPRLKPIFWDQLTDIVEKWNGPSLVMGHFNSVLDQKDKAGGQPVAQSSICRFRNLIAASGLIDMGFKGAAYTWTNCRVGKANIQERIDRGFINDEWRILFPQAYPTHLLAINNDHRPLLLNTMP